MHVILGPAQPDTLHGGGYAWTNVRNNRHDTVLHGLGVHGRRGWMRNTRIGLDRKKFPSSHVYLMDFLR